MAATLTAVVSASINWTYTNTPTGSTSGQLSTINSNTVTYSYSLSSGTGALGTADLLYVLSTTIAASSSVSADLVGTAVDAFGTTLSMARVKFMFLKHTSDTTATDISFGNATNPMVNWISAATSTVKIYNNGIFLIGSPSATSYALTGGSADAVKILNNDSSNTATVNLVIIGSSA